MFLAVFSWPSIIAGAAVFVALGLAALHATFVPQSRIWGHNISRGPRTQRGGRRVALTFDDGPTAGSTAQILDILERLNVRAAFFVIGANAAAQPTLLQRISAEGHLVENHSYTHAHLGMFRGPRFWRREIAATSELITASSATCRYFRPPVGMKNWFTLAAARRSGLKTITWSCRGMDGVATTPERIVERILSQAQNGDIIALHDGVEPGSRRDPQVTVQAIAPLIRGLRERGFELVRLDELLDPEVR